MHRQFFFTFLKLSADPRRCLYCDEQGCVALMLQNFFGLDVHISPSVGAFPFIGHKYPVSLQFTQVTSIAFYIFFSFLILPGPLVCLCLQGSTTRSARATRSSSSAGLPPTASSTSCATGSPNTHRYLSPLEHTGVNISHCLCHRQPGPAALPVLNYSCFRAEVRSFILFFFLR